MLYFVVRETREQKAAILLFIGGPKPSRRKKGGCADEYYIH